MNYNNSRTNICDKNINKYLPISGYEPGTKCLVGRFTTTRLRDRYK